MLATLDFLLIEELSDYPCVSETLINEKYAHYANSKLSVSLNN